MNIIITESQLKHLTEMDFRNLDDIIKFGEFSEHFKKEDLKKINKFLLLIRKLGVVNMFQAGDFFLMSIEYFRDFMRLKSYEREYDEEIVSEIEEMMPHIKSIMIGAGINLVEKNDIEVTPKNVEGAIKRLVSSIMKYYMTQNLPNVNESKNNFFSSEPLNASTDSHFMFTQVGKGYYQAVPFVSFPDEFYNYITSLGNDLESEIMDHLVSRVYIEASGDFNRIHFREGIHPELQGTGLGYLIYQDFIKFLGFASSSDSATKDSKKVWQKLLNDPDFYGVFCEGDNVLIVSKNWNGDTSSLFKTFISKKCGGNVLKINDSLLSDYPEFGSYVQKSIDESHNKAKNFLKDNFGFDFSGRIKQITSTYDVPKVFFDNAIHPRTINQWLNYWGPMYIFELDGVKYLYQDRGDFEYFIDQEGYEYMDNEIPEKLGIAEMGFNFSDILSMYFEEGVD
jgi:hypothetical protein